MFSAGEQLLTGNQNEAVDAMTFRVEHAPAAASVGAAGAVAALAAGAVGASLRQGRGQATARRVVGVCLPLTDKFDPLNLGTTDLRGWPSCVLHQDAKMDRYTAVEIKHGRVAMIATVGYIMPEIFRFPGCEDFKHGLGALESIPVEGWVQLFALVGAHEVLVKPREGGMGLYDFGLGTELLDGIDEEELERKQTAERNNGRLAMIAILGMMNGFWGEPVQFIVQHIVNCQSFSGSYVNNGGLCAQRPRGGRTVMRAMQKLAEGDYVELETYPKEMEMSPSVPFLRYPQVLKGWVGEEKGFDPLGVTDALPVYWVREAELKHGRVAMLATVGWIATDLGFRFPGEKFQAVANSVEAHDKMVEAGYMLPFFGAIGIFELFALWLFFQSWPIGEGINREAGDYWLGKQSLRTVVWPCSLSAASSRRPSSPASLGLSSKALQKTIAVRSWRLHLEQGEELPKQVMVLDEDAEVAPPESRRPSSTSERLPGPAPWAQRVLQGLAKEPRFDHQKPRYRSKSQSSYEEALLPLEPSKAETQPIQVSKLEAHTSGPAFRWSWGCYKTL
eukprot:s1145_g6.t1